MKPISQLLGCLFCTFFTIFVSILVTGGDDQLGAKGYIPDVCFGLAATCLFVLHDYVSRAAHAEHPETYRGDFAYGLAVIISLQITLYATVFGLSVNNSAAIVVLTSGIVMAGLVSSIIATFFLIVAYYFRLWLVSLAKSHGG